MITVYTISGCIRSKKLKSALKDRQIEFEEKSFFSLLADPKSFRALLEKPENKEALFVSSRSLEKIDAFKEQPEKLMKRMMETPSVIRRPLALFESEEEKGKLQFLVENASSCKSESCLYYPFCPMPHDERGVGVLSKNILRNEHGCSCKKSVQSIEAKKNPAASGSESSEKEGGKDRKGNENSKEEKEG